MHHRGAGRDAAGIERDDPVNRIAIKAGDTLEMLVSFTVAANGVPMALTGLTVTGEVRLPDGTLVAALTVASGPSPGTLLLTAPDTTEWPPGLMAADLVLTGVDGSRLHTPSWGITVERAVTP